MGPGAGGSQNLSTAPGIARSPALRFPRRHMPEGAEAPLTARGRRCGAVPERNAVLLRPSVRRALAAARVPEARSLRRLKCPGRVFGPVRDGLEPGFDNGIRLQALGGDKHGSCSGRSGDRITQPFASPHGGESGTESFLRSRQAPSKAHMPSARSSRTPDSVRNTRPARLPSPRSRLAAHERFRAGGLPASRHPLQRDAR